MKSKIYNPIFPLNEYVPDGEPHVFGDRVYLYGSHDSELGDRFCMNDYTVWSAPVSDLSDWTCHGTSYKKSQDKRAKANITPDYYAPDCVLGNDGKYYLYYVAMGPNVTNFGPISVAVANNPEGPFEYLDDLHYADGTPVLKFGNNDPTVLNDNGTIWLYYGWGLGMDFRNKLLSPIYNLVLSKIFKRSIKEIRATKPSIMDCAVVKLSDDMVTAISEPKSVLPSKTSAKKDSDFYNHPFYEAPSIRKFGNVYFLVYSSGVNNELCYATSEYPDKDFKFRGTIISNSDLGFGGNLEPKNNSGTIHGGIEKINGKFYVFYHRCTNNTDFSRQACAEPIVVRENGFISQVEVTTQGLNGEPLKAQGKFPAAICCNLYNPSLKRVKGNGNREKYPCVTFDGENRIVHNASKNTVISYKYFDILPNTSLIITAKNKGKLLANGNEINIDCKVWTQYKCALQEGKNKELKFVVLDGNIDLLEIEFV